MNLKPYLCDLIVTAADDSEKINVSWIDETYYEGEYFRRPATIENLPAAWRQELNEPTHHRIIFAENGQSRFPIAINRHLIYTPAFKKLSWYKKLWAKIYLKLLR